MDRFVVDASATLAWLFNEEGHSARLGPLFEHAELVAPWIWRLEVVNTVLVRERRKLLTPAQSVQWLELLDEWDVEWVAEPEGRALAVLAQMARPHQLTAYDAAYVEASLSLGLPLCTLDATMQRAARTLGIPLIIESDPQGPT